MAKKTILVSLTGILLLLSSCSPRISSSISKNYPPLRTNDKVTVIELENQAPAESELLGKVNIGDTGSTTDCNYSKVLEEAKQEARKAGGNAIKITKHDYPNGMSNCHRITAAIYRVKSFEEPANVAQTQDNSSVGDTIQITKAGLGYKYTYDNQILTMNTLQEFVQKNPNALVYFKKAKATSGFTSVLGYVGGFMIGWTLGSAIRGEEPPWTMALIGCGVIAVAFPIASGAENNLLKAVQTYNMGIKPSPQSLKYEIKLGVNQNGLGLAIRF